MRKIIIVLILFIFFVPKAEAHVLKTDGSIGAVLHVNPNDEPVANNLASFFFEFKDREGKFNPQDCQCSFVILENGEQVYSTDLFSQSSKPSLTSASATYTFPKGGLYQIKVVGKPNEKNSFQPFSLSYDIRVENGTAGQPNQAEDHDFFEEHVVHIIIGVAGLFLLGYIIFSNYKKK